MCLTVCLRYNQQMRGCLLLIEGLDRTGKSTQASILASRLNAKLVKFPDRDTPVGKLINEYLVNSEFHLPDKTVHLLFSANRWELAQSIQDTLESGTLVVMDRYVYSGIAYSLAKSGLNDFDWLYSPDKGLPKPDLTMFLTLSMDELSKRLGWGNERYERESFQREVKKRFLEILDRSDPTVAIVDVESLLVEEVTAKLMLEVEKRGAGGQTSTLLQRLS